MIKKLFLMAALLAPGLAYGGPSANLPVQIVPAGGVTGSILPFLPPGTTQWVYMGGDEFNGTSVDYNFWNGTNPDGTGLDGAQICQWLATITESGGLLHIHGADPSHCPRQPPWPPNGVCAFSCVGGEIISTFPGNSFGPGYYEARIFNSNAFYLAFWMGAHPLNCGTPVDGTEMDILEGYGSTYQNNTHWGGYGACHMSVPVQGLGPDDDGFHLIGLRWDPTDGYRYYRDGVETSHFPGPVTSGTGDVRFTVMAYDDTHGEMQVDWFRYWRAQ